MSKVHYIPFLSVHTQVKEEDMHVQFMGLVTKFFEALKVLQKELGYAERFLNPGRTSTRLRDYLKRMDTAREQVEKWSPEKLTSELDRVEEFTEELPLLKYFEPVRMIQKAFEDMLVLEPFGLAHILAPIREYLEVASKSESRLDVSRWSTPRFNFEVRRAKEILGEVTKLESKFLTSDWLRMEIERGIDIVDDYDLEAPLLKKHRAFHQLMTRDQFLSLMSEIDDAREEAAKNRIAEATTPKPTARRFKNRSAKSLADQELRNRMKGPIRSDDSKGHGKKAKKNA